MRGLGSHHHAKVSPPSTNQGLSGLASRRAVNEYDLVSDPVVASIHYDAFSKYLVSYIDKGRLAFSPSQLIFFIDPHSRFSEQTNTIPRRKLAKLTPLQFQELCTDVYDELIRRQNNSETINGQGASCYFLPSDRHISPPALVPFLGAQAGFHPKRNQAREKLATLRPPRFQELTSDVRHELGRRYPGCNELVVSFSFPFV